MLTISCLCCTHGRYQLLRRAIACFLVQDYPSKELLIFNHHPVPLVCDLPGVRVVNEPNEAMCGTNLNRLLDMSSGDLVRLWDDDDLYLPNTLTQGVEHLAMLPNRVAWKPRCSWFFDGSQPEEKQFSLQGNHFEASVTWRGEFVREHRYSDEEYTHRRLHQRVTEAGGIAEGDVPATFVSLWGNGVYHISGTLGNHQTSQERSAAWRAANQDHGDGKPLEPANVQQWWRRLAMEIPEAHRTEWMWRAHVEREALCEPVG